MQPNPMLDMDMNQRMMNPNGPAMINNGQMMPPHIMKQMSGPPQQFGGGMMDNQQPQIFNPNQPQDPNMMIPGNRNQIATHQQQHIHRQQPGPPQNMMQPMHQMDPQQMQLQQQQMGRHAMGMGGPSGPQPSPFDQNLMMNQQMPPHMQQQQPYMNNQGQMMHPSANFMPNDQMYAPPQMSGMENGQMMPPHMLQQQQQQDQFTQQQIGGMPSQQQLQMSNNPDLLSSYTDFKPDFDQILFTE